MIKSGWVYSYGMGFWGPNGHDGIWHIALAQSLAKGSWQMPIFASDTIQNYHIGFDLVLAWIYKLTRIGFLDLYFQILPPVFAFFIGLTAYKFVHAWKKSHSQAFWATFFVYFGGSWGWLITFLRSGDIGGESLFWSQQSISTLVNPPFALSILVIFAALWVLIQGLKTKDKRLLILSTFLFGILIQIKVYAGVLVLAGLFVSGIGRMLKREGIDLIKVFLGATLLSILLFSPVSDSVGQTIRFKPFWFLEEMMASNDRFFWPKMASAIANYKLAGSWFKLSLAYGLSFLLFWYGNLGTRFIKEPYVFRWFQKPKKLPWIEIFLACVILAGVVIPLFFVQSGTSWNTIQFMYYSLMLSGILGGVYLGQFLEKTNLNTLLLNGVKVTVVVLTIPTTFGTLWYHYLPSRPPAKVSREELAALHFLSQQPDGVVLTQPFNKKLADEAVTNPPRPLYLYESTAYVSALSGKPTYLEDEVNLEITGYNWRERRSKLESFLGTLNPEEARAFLLKENITYVYWVKSIYGPISENQKLLGKLFENQEVQIFKLSSRSPRF